MTCDIICVSPYPYLCLCIHLYAIEIFRFNSSGDFLECNAPSVRLTMITVWRFADQW